MRTIEDKKLKLSDENRIIVLALLFLLLNIKVTPFGERMQSLFQSVYPLERNTVSFFLLLLAV